MQLWPFSFSFMSIYFCMNMHIETNTAHNSRRTAHLHVLHNDAGKTVKICVYLLYKQLLCSIKEAGLEIPYYSIDIALFALRYHNASTLVMNTKVPLIQISGKGVLRIEESCICKCSEYNLCTYFPFYTFQLLSSSFSSFSKNEIQSICTIYFIIGNGKMLQKISKNVIYNCTNTLYGRKYWQ